MKKIFLIGIFGSLIACKPRIFLKSEKFDISRFEGIKIGESRMDVEKRLGKALSEYPSRTVKNGVCASYTLPSSGAQSICVYTIIFNVKGQVVSKNSYVND